ncbi:RecQ family ATP-dependent DNA helicase [Panacibacter ginsenosidivorans]|uniref:ATP-dependent DNA helicase RecQ n=1 Tax=Panacibacter ginsenosidivorans TaxID=1813871 RepID=A0A5B8VA36_9BACT|nr:ATP-dependent DNA helicase RecQ [Panacibacter ginsenosidivorans]QEC67556.1 RecQ family ATP-dependent DNA helicase [Panacibacter ginsenosidivorans]
MNETALNILQQYWHHDAFRPQQEAIIASVLDEKDTLALLPTGGGKSVCFQVPALMKDGLCLVISPLIALMKDQVENLVKRNIPAISIHSGMTFYEVRQALQQASHGDIKFLYLSPERLETNLFKESLHHLNISLIAVDEAHCVSQWGYDFRPPYLRIANLRDELPDVPILALTASATPLVQDDIVVKLRFKEPNIFRQSFEKPNLSYSVFKVDSKINRVMEILKNVNGSSIIYCRNRRLTKEVAHLLSLQNISADFYHAGLSQDDRNNKQESWINNRTRVIVCTNAFGMGIDKADVRTVIHYDTPDCLENYYQEAGRAGRDGKRAYAVLLYQPEDAATLEALPDVRFPVMYDIRKIYQALADYLQIPVGSGEGCYYDFDLNEFVKNFKLDIHLVINVLKVLEQEGHLTFNESIFLPSQVKFLVAKELLLDFEQSHPSLEPVIKCLLRTYEGVYNNRVSVHERQIAKLTRKKIEEVRSELMHLDALGIIEYLPQKETPQIYFILNRAPAQFLYINHENYLQRKQQFELRTETMLRYLHLQKECRSKYISNYFGDVAVKECGICDVCLHKKGSGLTEEEFNKIQQRIFHHTDNIAIPVKDLLEHLQGIRKEKIWKVLEFLQSEKKIEIDEFGIIKSL